MSITSLIRRLGSASNGQETEYDTPLSFSVLEEYPDKPEMQSRFVAVGKHGKVPVYSLLAFNLSVQDIKTLGRLKSQLIQELLNSEARSTPGGMEEAKSMSLGLLSRYETKANKEILAYLLAHDTIGYGPFSILMEDSSHIEEIIVNSPESSINVYHSTYGYCKTNMRFNGEKSFRYMLNKMIEGLEKEVNAATPIVDAQLPDGSRLHAQIRPYSINGVSASIRLPGSRRFDVRELLKQGTADEDIFSYLWLAMEAKANVIISGAPSSGKTTMLSTLLSFVPQYHRIITIEEDVNEIKLDEADMNHVALQGSTIEKHVRVKDQVINALHMRPDVLVLGEVRGEEAKEVFFGANVGVQFITTMHSNLDKTALISRLSTKPMSVEPQSLCMLDIAIFMKSEGFNERKIDKIVEYRWLQRGEMPLPESGDGEFEACEIVADGKINQEALKNSKITSMYAVKNIVTKSNSLKELKKRATFLNTLKASDSTGLSARAYIRKYGAIS